MSKAFRSLMHSALAVVLAIALYPLPALANTPQNSAVNPDAAESAVALANENAQAEGPMVIETETFQDGLSLGADNKRVSISKDLTAYCGDVTGNWQKYESKGRDCGDAGFVEVVDASDGSKATLYPYVGQLVAFKVGSKNGYRLLRFGFKFTSPGGKELYGNVDNGKVIRVGAYKSTGTVYEFVVPSGSNYTLYAEWEKNQTRIVKSLTSPAGTTQDSQCEAGTCFMVNTTKGAKATKYPLGGSRVAFQITTNPGYVLDTFRVKVQGFDTRKDAIASSPNGEELLSDYYFYKPTVTQKMLYMGKDITRVGDYKPDKNTYEFDVPDYASISTIYVTWRAEGQAAPTPPSDPSTPEIPDNVDPSNPDATDPERPDPNPDDTPRYDVDEYLATDSGAYNGISWRVYAYGDDGGVLVIEGEGDTNIHPWYDPTDTPPWYEYNFMITEAYVYSGITSLCTSAFRNSPYLETVHLPKTLTEIGGNAFQGCTSLKTIDVPDSVTYIGDQAFFDCSALESFKIPSGITQIHAFTFSGCSNMTSIDIPDSLMWIDQFAFSGCGSLSNIMLPSALREIGRYGFQSCTALQSVDISEGATEIGICAFELCSNLKSVTIPSTMKRIGYSAFNECTSLREVHASSTSSWLNIEMGDSGSSENATAAANPLSNGADFYLGDDLIETLIVPAGTTDIPMYAFHGCTSIRNVSIPGSVSRARGFRYCTNLEKVTIGEGVEQICDYGFNSCKRLTSVSIPSSVTNIEAYSFYASDSLTKVNVPATAQVGYNAFPKSTAINYV